MTAGDSIFLYNPPTRVPARGNTPSMGNGVTCCHRVTWCHRVSGVPRPRPRPIAEVLLGIAQRLRHLGPDHRDPHRFHEQKSELVAELRRLARRAA